MSGNFRRFPLAARGRVSGRRLDRDRSRSHSGHPTVAPQPNWPATSGRRLRHRTSQRARRAPTAVVVHYAPGAALSWLSDGLGRNSTVAAVRLYVAFPSECCTPTAVEIAGLLDRVGSVEGGPNNASVDSVGQIG